MTSTFSIKQKVTIYLVLIICALSLVVNLLLYYQHNFDIKERKISTAKQLRASFENSIARIKNSFSHRGMFLTKEPDLISGLRENDLEDMTSFVRKRWEVFSLENIYLNQMKLYRADNKIVVEFNSHGDIERNIFRDDIVATDAIRKGEIKSGFNISGFRLVYDVAVPIKSKRETLGAISFGIGPDYIINEVKNSIGVDGALFIKDADVNFNTMKKVASFDGYSVITDSETLAGILKKPEVDFRLENGYEFESADRIYATHVFPIESSQGKELGEVVFLQDVTSYMNHMYKYLVINFIVTAVVIVLLTMLIHKSISYLLGELEKFHARNKSIVETLPGIVTIVDNNMKVLDVSDSLLKAAGIKNKEHVIGEDYSFVFADCRKMNTTTDSKYEMKCDAESVEVYKGNAYKTYTKNILDTSGEKLGCLKMMLDISDLFEKEKQLQKSRKYNESIIDSQPALIVVSDGENIISVNKRFLAFFNYERFSDFTEDYGTKCVITSAGDSIEREDDWYYIISRPISGMGEYKAKLKPLSRQGREMIFQVSVHKFDVDELNSRYLVSFNDVTEFEITQQNLLEVNKLLGTKIDEGTQEIIQKNRLLVEKESIFKSAEQLSGAGSWQIELNDMRYAWTDGRFKIFGYEPFSIAIDASFMKDHVDESDYKVYEYALENVVNNGGPVDCTYRIKTKKGESRTIKSTMNVIYDDNGNPYKIYGVDRDITEILLNEKIKKNQEKMFIQQSKMASMGEMLGVIAHQWKQPLNSIGITAQLIADDFEHEDIDTEEVVEYTNNIVEYVHFLSQTLEDFRTFFKPDNEAEVFNVCQAVIEAKDIIKAQLDKTSVRFELATDNLDDRDIRVIGSKTEFKQVVMNLMNNSIDAIVSFREKGGKAGEIKAMCKSEGEFLSLSFEDDGGGIPDTAIDNIFDSYYTTKGHSGTGIGLYLTKLIIEGKMYGSISASNSNCGAVFVIKLKKAV